MRAVCTVKVTVSYGVKDPGFEYREGLETFLLTAAFK